MPFVNRPHSSDRLQRKGDEPKRGRPHSKQTLAGSVQALAGLPLQGGSWGNWYPSLGPWSPSAAEETRPNDSEHIRQLSLGRRNGRVRQLSLGTGGAKSAESAPFVQVGGIPTLGWAREGTEPFLRPAPWLTMPHQCECLG